MLSWRSLVCHIISWPSNEHRSSIKLISYFSVSRRTYIGKGLLTAHKTATYMRFLFKSGSNNVFKLVEFVTADFAQLFAELAVFVDELLDHVHLLRQLVKLRVCERFGVA